MEQEVLKYLKQLNIPVSKSYFEKLIASHPDYPSLLSIADTLERFGIPHQAVRVKQEDLEHIPFPYMLHFDKHGGELVIVKDQKNLIASEPDLKHWNGVLLHVESDVDIADKEYYKQLSEEKFLKHTLGVFLGAVTVLLFLPSIQALSWLYACLLISALGGAVTGYFLLAKDLGISYRAVEVFCNAGTGANCDRILKSEDARLFGRITFSDAVMIYFAFQLLMLGFAVPLLEGAATFLLTLSAMSLFVLPVVIYSIWYQGVKAKTWCRLCLLVDAILIIQLVLFGYMASQGLIQPGTVDALSLVLFGALFLATGASVLLVKTELEKANRSRQAEVKANRIKNSPEVFLHMLHQSRRADTTPFKHEIWLGKLEAPIQITMGANLFCHPCKVGFGKVSQLLSAYQQKVNLAIRLLRSGRGNGEYPVASRYLLAWWLSNIHGEKEESTLTKELIRDWYGIMNIAEFMEKYPQEIRFDDRDQEAVEELESWHTEWFEQERITKTPTWFVNGYELPEAYSIEDLMAMVPGLAQNFANFKKKESESKVVS